MAMDWSKLNQLAGNPLFAGGLQLMGAGMPTTSTANPFSGVAPAMALAARTGSEMQQMKLQQEAWERKKAERDALTKWSADLSARAQAPGVAAGGPLPNDPRMMGQELLRSGIPELQMQGIKLMTTPPKPPLAPQEFTRKEGDKIITYRRDPHTLKEERIAEADRYRPQSTSVSVQMPGAPTARPMTPEEANAWGIPPDKAPNYFFNNKGEPEVRPLFPGESKAAEAEAAAEAGAPKRQMQYEQMSAKVNVVTDAIDTALSQVSPLTTGLGGAVMGKIPGSAATNLRATLRTVKANIGFNELQAMRASSPTGGALGQVAVQELESLQSVLGSLDQEQSDSQLIENLNKVRSHVQNWRRIMAEYAGQTQTPSGEMVSPQWGQGNDPLKLFSQ